MKALCATPNGSVINHNSDLLFLSLMIHLGLVLFCGCPFCLQQRVGCRDHDVSDQLVRGERDENANGDFTGFYGIEFFEEIIHGSSPWVERLFG
jgi:hypothetical protein